MIILLKNMIFKMLKFLKALNVRPTLAVMQNDMIISHFNQSTQSALGLCFLCQKYYDEKLKLKVPNLVDILRATKYNSN